MDKFATSEHKVTYLIGAGASANALPIIKKIAPKSDEEKYVNQNRESFSDRLIETADYILNHAKVISSFWNQFEELASSLKTLAVKTKQFGTPDTYAKYLYLQDREEFYRVKSVLSAYFIIEQLLFKKIEERVLPFMASVMQIGNIFPSNVKILSWNYDIQFQIASDTFNPEQLDMSSTVHVHKPPTINYYPNLGRHLFNDNDADRLDMIQLNGIAGYCSYKSGYNEIIIRASLNGEVNKLDDLGEYLFERKDKKEELLQFAWENSRRENGQIISNKVIHYSKAMIQNTDILVIIGYSFPFFNRLVDKEIFDALKQSGRLKKIYFQDPFRKGDFLIGMFELHSNTIIESVDYVDSYFIPNEI